MARHTIQIPINKSSNTKFSKRWIYAEQVGIADYRNVQMLSSESLSGKLYCLAQQDANRPKVSMGLAWDSSLIPSNKTIVSVKLYLYTIKGHSRPVYYKFGDFSEGSTIPSYSPADGGKSGGMPTGWGYVNISELKGSSLIVGADLQFIEERLSGYNIFTWEYWELYSHRNATLYLKEYLENII